MSSPLTVGVDQPMEPADTPALPEDARPKVELIETDGEPLESDWHRLAIALLIEAIKQYHSGRTDFYAGGNMFIYYDEEEARAPNSVRHNCCGAATARQ